MNFDAKRIRTIVFDLDGTLLNTLDDLAASTNYALRRNSLSERGIDEIKAFVGNGVRKLIERAVPAGTPTSVTNDVFACFKQHYALHCMDKTDLYAGVGAMLEELHAAGYRMGIVSNKLQSGVDKLYRHFFRGTVRVAVGEREGIRRKPEPDMVESALKEMNAGKEEAVYVGDSDVDVATAANAGLPCISVLWGFRDRAFLAAHGAERFAEVPADILPMLQGEGKTAVF